MSRSFRPTRRCTKDIYVAHKRLFYGHSSGFPEKRARVRGLLAWPILGAKPSSSSHRTSHRRPARPINAIFDSIAEADAAYTLASLGFRFISCVRDLLGNRLAGSDSTGPPGLGGNLLHCPRARCTMGAAEVAKPVGCRDAGAMSRKGNKPLPFPWAWYSQSHVRDHTSRPAWRIAPPHGTVATAR